MISMAKFNDITVNEDNTVTLGVGLTWDQVYKRITPLGITIAGGRVSGVGRLLHTNFNLNSSHWINYSPLKESVA